MKWLEVTRLIISEVTSMGSLQQKQHLEVILHPFLFMASQLDSGAQLVRWFSTKSSLASCV
jgi:hypothetical protein